ncbi:MAG: hypothetical protein VW380_01075 [Candidatus Woesearchaeota archaeon]
MSLEIISDTVFPYLKMGDFNIKVKYDIDRDAYTQHSLLDFNITTDCYICIINERDISRNDLIDKINSNFYSEIISNKTLVKDLENNSQSLIDFIENLDRYALNYNPRKKND